MNNSATISPATLDFFTQIQDNNNKEWFEVNKKSWEAVKENYALFMGQLQDKIVEIDTILIKEPKKYVSRINRDFRFTPDKSPYRNHIFSLFGRDDNEKSPRFYIQIQPNNTFIAAGLWSPESDTLKKVRQEIDYNSSELHTVLNTVSFKDYYGTMTGESLSRPPQGYDASNPNVELLKLKQYIVRKTFSDDFVTSPDFMDELVKAYKEVMPLLNFLSVAISE